ncbi:Hypothetical predicted protein [Mytilus galloprovincialis]|uniref:Uncharacterized protein n=1 Tax=Mytilus galloprovincialis TaxID=29158 RepID=A0A8B6D2N3_MYTGA|nr:Hypothetical predicted protein [Mytilus galloprovincialis]
MQLWVFTVCVVVLLTIETDAKVPVVCAKKTFNEWQVDVHHRFDEVSQYDCPSSSCGGQCVALVKCACGAPYTGLWSPGYNVAAYCQHGTGYVAHGTAIATFEHGTYNNRWTDHTAVFLRCSGNGKFQVMEQACEFSARLAEYSSLSSYYHRFSVILTDHGNLNPSHHCSRKHRSC